MNTLSLFAVTYNDANVKIPGVNANSTVLGNIFNVVLALAGAIAVAFIVWAGIQYVLSRGEPAKIKQAKDTILYALIGIVVVMLSFVIVNYIVGQFK